MFYICEDGKTILEFNSVLEYQNKTKNHNNPDSRLFAVHPDKNKNISQDPGTGKYVYTDPILNIMKVLEG